VSHGAQELRSNHVGAGDGAEGEREVDVSAEGGAEAVETGVIGSERIVPAGEIAEPKTIVQHTDLAHDTGRGAMTETPAGDIIRAEGAAGRTSAAGEDPARRHVAGCSVPVTIEERLREIGR